MATMLGSLLISLGLNSGQFTKGMDDAQRDLVKFQKQAQRTAGAMKDLGAKMTIGITAPLAAFGGFSVKAASDAAELQSAFDQTFGSLSRSMTQWAEDTGDAMGRSTQEIQQMANTFGIFFNQAAPTREAAADLSRQFAVLAQDLSSFFNTDPTEALQKLRSGLAGESEPLRDFGVFLTEATVKTKALEMGLVSAGGELTEQNKIMARAALIMEATTNAQGDVARTADGTANRIRAAKAAFEELQVAIGEKLLPAVTPLITGLTAMLGAFTELPDWVQTSTVVVGGLAAVAGPLVYTAGALTTNMILLGGAFAGTGVAATGASAGVTLLAGAMRGLLLTGAPIVLALTAVAGVMYLVSRRSKESAQASATLQDQQQKLEKIQLRVKTVTEQLAVATGAARKEALANAKALREEALQAMFNARAKLFAARATARQKLREAEVERDVARRVGGGLTRDQFGGTGIAISGPAQKAAEKAQANVDAQAKIVRDTEVVIDNLNRQIGALAPVDTSTPKVDGAGKSKTGPSSGPSGPSQAEINERFASEIDAYTERTWQAERSIALSAEERAEYELRSVNLAHKRLLSAIENDKDYSGPQKKIATAALEVAVAAEKEAIAFNLKAEKEREAAELAEERYRTQADALRLQYDLADTDARRKAIALKILETEDDYLRSKLNTVLASETAEDAEKARARIALQGLEASASARRAAVARANETELERYVRGLNLSSGQINEALDAVKIDGLDALNQGLADAVRGVKSLGDVFKNIANQIISDLLRIAVQKAIVAPLANSLFGGGGGGGFLNSLFSGGGGGSSHGGGNAVGGSGMNNSLSGARAMGGPVLAGGRYLVGENGPELFSPTRSGHIVPNHELVGASESVLSINLGPGLEADLLQKAAGQTIRINEAMAPPMVNTAAAKARRDAARPIMPGGATG